MSSTLPVDRHQRAAPPTPPTHQGGKASERTTDSPPQATISCKNWTQRLHALRIHMCSVVVYEYYVVALVDVDGRALHAIPIPIPSPASTVHAFGPAGCLPLPHTRKSCWLNDASRCHATLCRPVGQAGRRQTPSRTPRAQDPRRSLLPAQCPAPTTWPCVIGHLLYYFLD
jgi:hypothetical protein